MFSVGNQCNNYCIVSPSLYGEEEVSPEIEWMGTGGLSAQQISTQSFHIHLYLIQILSADSTPVARKPNNSERKTVRGAEMSTIYILSLIPW